MAIDDNTKADFDPGGGPPGETWRDESLFCHDLPSKPDPGMGRILVTGAFGYIGGRLLPELLARGYKVRVMVRGAIQGLSELWPEVEVAVADALEIDSLRKSLEGVDAAYYLIHSMLLGPREFAKADWQAAVNFSRAAEENDVGRIIYLGGLGDIRSQLSDHLRSRMEVAEELKHGKTPVTILRAAMIIGSGSASYEILKHIVVKLPVIPIPGWADNKCQPISVRDVIKYLVGVLEMPETSGETFDIGGTEVLTYRSMVKKVAGILGKKRLFIPFPLLSIRFYAYIVSLLTPVPGPITRCLVESLRNDVICQNNTIKDFLPFEPMDYKVTIIRALSREEQDRVHTRWSDAYPPSHELALKLVEMEGDPMYTSSHSILTGKDASSLFDSICKIGGNEGWFHGNWMWRLRGGVDRVLMGVGSSRGRRHSTALGINDVIDFWRVEDLQYGRRLLLRAEMKLPGKAWLEFNIGSEGTRNRLTVKAYYYAVGLFGRIYWYLFLPFHHIIFKGLIKQIAKRS